MNLKTNKKLFILFIFLICLVGCTNKDKPVKIINFVQYDEFQIDYSSIGEIVVEYGDKTTKTHIVTIDMLNVTEIEYGSNNVILAYTEFNTTLRFETVIKLQKLELELAVFDAIDEIVQNKEYHKLKDLIIIYSEYNFKFKSNSPNVFRNDGVILDVYYDQEVSVEVVFTIKEVEFKKTIVLELSSTVDNINLAIQYINNLVPNMIHGEYKLTTFVNTYQVTVNWYYNNQFIENGALLVDTIDQDYTITLKAVFKYLGLEEIKEYNIVVRKLSDSETIKNMIKELYENQEITENIDLDYLSELVGVEVYLEPSNKQVIKSNGQINRNVIDVLVTVEFYFYITSYEHSTKFNLTVLGYGTDIEKAIYKYTPLIPQTIKDDYTLPTYDSNLDVSIEWLLDGVYLTDGLINLERKDDDYELNLTAIFNSKDEKEVLEFTIKAIMLSDLEKVNKVLNLYRESLLNYEVTTDFLFEKKDPFYNAILTWKSFSPDLLAKDGTYFKPLLDTEVMLMLTARINQTSERCLLKILVKGEESNTMWEKIENFLNRIHKSEIKTQSFYLYGWEEGYTQVPTKNIGYLPFYLHEEVKLTIDLLPSNSPLKPNRNRQSTNFITLHNTGMAHPSATAYGLNEYIHTTDRIASWHFSIDDKEAYQHLGLNEVGWHAGDGSTVAGSTYYNTSFNYWAIGGGNQNSIGIEMCVYAGVDFNWVMRNTAKIVSNLLVQYKLTPADIRQHYDFAGKNCPQVIRQANRWEEMLELISLEYYALVELEGVTFEWISKNPDIMNNKGAVINNPGVDTKISYQVNVRYNGEVKTFDFSSLLKKI